MRNFETALEQHDFRRLFIEQLGWDHVSVQHSLVCRDESFALEAVAQKRGFLALCCKTDRTILADRHFLRDIQKQVRKSYYEHILIFHSEVPLKQVWAWSFQGEDGQTVIHREHPFFSESCPPLLLQRLKHLLFRLDEEGEISIVDVIARVRSALLPEAEFKLFATWPGYARATERLAMAYRSGDISVLPQLVYMHLPLARKWSKLARLWFRLEADEAEQIAVLGLIDAAKRFDPERGYQFSTNAVPWIRQACGRYGLQVSQFIRIPDYLYWPCVKVQKALSRLEVRWGRSTADGRTDEELRRASIQAEDWQRFRLSRELRLASNMPQGVWRACQVIDATTPVAELVRLETRRGILREIDELPEREATIIRKRWGIDGPEHTLAEIGQSMRMTREGIRQIEVRTFALLRRRLADRGLEPDDGRDQLPAPEAEPRPEDVAPQATMEPEPEPQADEGLATAMLPDDLDELRVEDTGVFEKSDLQQELALDETTTEHD
jgi:RNA polymerase sigma factor (sigma-70 family)